MAPPPDSAAEVRSPCWRRAIHRTKGRAGATSARARLANRYQDRHAVSRFSSQAGTQSEADSTPQPAARWRIVTDHPLSATPAVGADRPLSTYSLPTISRVSLAGG